MADHRLAVERGVGGDESIQAAIDKHAGKIADLGLFQIRSHLEKQWDVFPMFSGEFLLLLLECLQKPRTGLRAL